MNSSGPRIIHPLPRGWIRSVPHALRQLIILPFFLLSSAGVGALSPEAMPAMDAGSATDSGSNAEARVSGTVVASATGVPLSGVLVEIEGMERWSNTDGRGRFEIRGIPDEIGEVTLRFERLGYAQELRTLTLAAGEAHRLEVAMERGVVQLDPIAVLLERTRMIGDPAIAGGVPGSAFHLTREDLDASSLVFDNVHDVLRQVPGVHVQDEEGFGLRPHIGMRGAGAERSSNITLMEDGVLIAPAPYAAPAAYYFPTTGRMDGIEVRKGASQIRYGPRTLGGAVNLISAAIPDRRDWMVEVAGGGDAMTKAHARVGDASEHVGWLIEGFNLRTDGFKELQGGGGTGFDTRDFMGKLRLNTDRSGPRYQEIEVKLGYTDHTSDETYLGLTDADFSENGLLRYAASAEDLMDTEHRQIQLRHFIQPTDRTDVVTTLYRNEFARNWYKLQSVGGTSIAGVLSNPSENADLLDIMKGADSDADALQVRANNREYLSEGAQIMLGARAGSSEGMRHNLEAGIRFHRDREDRLQWEDGYRMAEGTLVRTSSGTPGTQANRVGEASAVALHIQNEVRTGAWTVTPGLRYESIDLERFDWAPIDSGRLEEPQLRSSSVSAFIPGIGASYEWSPWTHIFAGVHRGFGPPGPGADEETRVEESVNYETGVRIRRAGIGANFTGFFSDYSNILGQATLATGETGTGELYNGGAVHVYGVEAAVDADLSRYVDFPVALPVRASYTFNRGTFQSSFQSNYGPWGTVESGDRLPYMPEHLWSGSLGLEDPAWSVGLAWNGASAMRTEAGRGSVTPEAGVERFNVFNLSGEVRVSDRGWLYAAVQNLTDERYVVSRRPAGARPGLPQTVMMGVRFAR